MPLIAHSSYQPPRFCGGAHFQTIYPSFFMKEREVDYERERFNTPDGDYLYLDWAKCPEPSPAHELLIVSHGLCGGTHRHYALSLVHAFRRCHIDCLCWNYRGTGRVDNQLAKVTTNNSTYELQWVIEHAIAMGYQNIYLAGFSMGANLSLLYLGREAKNIPEQVRGAAVVCATMDVPSCIISLQHSLGGIYQWHFMKPLRRCIAAMHAQHPEIDIAGLDKIKTFPQFDDRYTAPLMGSRDSQDYYKTSSANQWLEQISLPTLIINPANDPFLSDQCFPREIAARMPNLFLEIPPNGGHCGFITPKKQEWWPAQRIRQFMLETVRPANQLPALPLDKPQPSEA